MTLEVPAGREVIRVAVADDQELFRRGLALLLAAEDDFDVVGEAADGDSAAEVAVRLVPDVMLLDVRMPRRSGIEACALIKRQTPEVRVIMLTASDEDADLYDAIRSGASGYLLKDSSVSDVSQAVRLVASGHSLVSPVMATKLLTEFKSMTGGEIRPHRVPRLTEREVEVLSLISRGLNNREIADKLFISENTVKNHVRNMLEKLQLHSRIEAVMYAVRQRLLDPP